MATVNIIRYTDDTLTFRMQGIDLTNTDPIIVSFKQNGRVVEIPEEQIDIVDSGKMIVALTQRDTAKLDVGSARIQINVGTDEGRFATNDTIAEAEIKVLDNHIRREM